MNLRIPCRALFDLRSKLGINLSQQHGEASSVWLWIDVALAVQTHIEDDEEDYSDEEAPPSEDEDDDDEEDDEETGTGAGKSL